MLAFVFALAVSFESRGQTTPVRIMPLGDSITYGSSTPGGYRFPLYVALTNAGYTVDYVGTQTGNATNLLGAEINHQGIGGWRISDAIVGLYENMYGWFEQIDDPHVVLLHIGTNDSGGGNFFTNAVDRLDALVTRIAQCQPSARIIVTTLLPRGGSSYTAITNYFNPFVPSKVAGQQALGRNVYFLDMHNFLTTNDMYDALHPTAEGYAKMAGAWLPAITNIIGTTVTANVPAPLRAKGGANAQQVAVTFNKKLSSLTATNAANYAITNAAGSTLAVTGAALSADQRTVTLTTAPQTRGTNYVITINNVADTNAPALTVPANSQVIFQAATPRGYANNAADSAGYTLAYSLDIPAQPSYQTAPVSYSADNSARIGRNFGRVAYYMELQPSYGTDLQYVWVSMDAFTNDVKALGVPTLLSGALFQRSVSNLTVESNHPDVTSGSGFTGNIEFWPYGYGQLNSPAVAGASDSYYDFGDQCSFSGNHGSMQIHNTTLRKTLFGFNRWGGTGDYADLGIGSRPLSGDTDWTHAKSGGIYTLRTLQVLVKLDASDTTPPAPTDAHTGLARTLVAVTFSEPLAAASVPPANFSLNNGVQVLSATLLPDQCTVKLATTAQPGGLPLTLAVSGVRDLSGNPVAEGTAITVNTLPKNVKAFAGFMANNFELTHVLDIPVTGTFIGTPDFYRYIQSGPFTGSIDRVAYYVELQKWDGTVQTLWASMDAFTNDARKIAVPTTASGAFYQQYVSNLVVKSTVSGVSNGFFATGGNLEFWPGNYSPTNTFPIPGASSTAYDFGDRMDAGGHGCMQIHNSAARQTLFAMNNWGTDNQKLSVGIGNQSSGNPDWTAADNAGTTYARRTLYVLARRTALPVASLPPPSQVLANVPESAAYQHVYTIDLPVKGTFFTQAPTYYSVNNATNGAASLFSRIAYYLELQSGTGPTQYVWTAMDAFTSDITRIGVPVTNCVFQQKVTRLDVRSNVSNIVTGTSLETGNIEFWPHNYGGGNTLNIPNANGTAFDFGDSYSSPVNGHGCMQVHNHGASQTLFAINSFNNNNTLSIGIGNNTNFVNSASNPYPDWTFSYNAGSYNHRRLHVFVLPGTGSELPDLVRPTITRALASRDLDQVAVRFSEPLSESAATPSFFALNNGATVSSARLLADKKEVVLTTSALTAGLGYVLTVNGVCDRSSAANPILPGSTASFTAPAAALPTVLSNVPEAAGYELTHQLAIANATYYLNGCNYTTDESLFAHTNGFDRIAYCLELTGTNGVAKWVYVSMDAFTPDITKIGVPTFASGAIFQQYVSNLNVFASDNVANLSVTTGTGIASGNIEFWPYDYGSGNAFLIPNASESTYDFGDGRSTGGSHGSMQVHNYAARHTIFAFNNFGGDNRLTSLGIGNQPSNHPDWTANYNANAFSTKNLYVLARPGRATPPAIWSQPRSLTAYLGTTARFYVYAPDAYTYQWRKDGAPIAGADQACLDIPAATPADAGTYDVIVMGPSGNVVSQSATLTVSAYSPPLAPRPLRIMPLGDSITYGANTAGGYRLPLHAALTSAGYAVDYVGTRTDNGSASLPDPDHQGLSGWTISQINNNIMDWLFAVDDPDVILLHIGTNDSNDLSTFPAAIDRLTTLITRIATNRPYASIIVTTLMKRSEATKYAAITNAFNPYVEARVNAQRALGRKVHFLDMHAKLELTDMYDGLHPNAGGYAKMASAWFSSITNIVGVYGATNAPALCRAANTAGLQGVTVTFSKALDPSTATNVANYALSGGLSIAGATLSSDLRTVTLATTAPLATNAFYTVTVNGVKDYAWPVQQTIAPNSADTFQATVRGYQANVPAAELAGFKLAYAIGLPNAGGYSGGNLVNYGTNNTLQLNGALTRVAYYLELQRLDGDLNYLWVSMDPFTDDIKKIGIPAFATGAFFRKPVANMNVWCNNTNVLSGTGLNGNMEFWSCNYGGGSGGQPAGADDTLLDFGDTPSTGGTYGCMQIHNTDARKTLFAINNWGSSGGIFDIGIGNNPTGQPDWTFMNNAPDLPVRALYVLVQTADDVTPPTLVSALAGAEGTLVAVTFSEAILPDSADGSRFALDNGVSVISATLLPDQKTVHLLTTPQPAGTTLTLTVNRVYDIGGGNPIAPNSTITVTTPALPPSVVAAVGDKASGYELVYSLDIPITARFNSTADPYYYNQSLATGSFDRVAYFMELVKQDSSILPPNNAITQYVWTAMDAFTPSRKKIGVPTVASAAVFQQYVSNLVVQSNVGGISNGTFVAGGNIEFWPSFYSESNALGIPGASASTFDFGDSGGSSTTGHGAMQVHNSAAKQTLFAFNRWGSDGSTTEMGIGNQASGSPDWTHAANAPAYSRRILHVMVHPTGPRLPYDTDTTAPALSSASAPSRAFDKVLLVFSETLSDRATQDGTFALNSGLTVTSANLQADKRSIVLSTSPMAPGQTYQVTVSGVRDRSANGNLIAAGSTASFITPPSELPAVLANVPEAANYVLIYQLAVSNTAYYANGCNYTVDESRFGATQTFDRIAYCMELTDLNSVSKWVYVSMNAFNPDIAKIGVPTANRGAMFQQYVSNMNVYGSANVVDISLSAGTGIPAGNIEFWPSDYSAANSLNIPGASATAYDFGDGGGNGTTAGHGSMQIHNFAEAHTILSLSHFGKDTYAPALGIGSNLTTSDPDWTATYNAASFTVKNLYVLVRWSAGPAPGAGPAIFVQPRSRAVFPKQNVSFYVQAANATAYQWRRNGAWIPGATQPVLELTPALQRDAGLYDVLVYNASGYTASESAELSFYPPGTKLILR